MSKPPHHLKFSAHHTPPERYRHVFYAVLRAGHSLIQADYPLMGWLRPGHDLLLGIGGSGRAQIGGRSFTINPGELCWGDHQRTDVHYPDRSEPWEFFWMRVDCGPVDAIAEALNVTANPLFKLRKPDQAAALFKSIFRLLRGRRANMDAALHAAISSLIAILFEVRQSAATGTPLEQRGAHPRVGLDLALGAMREEYQRAWKVQDLAHLANLSVPQFFRRFHQATGSSPIDWLRRERINQAKRRLGETRERIRDIAQQVGYGDPLYFSRDFKKLAGMSPRQYRQQEQP
jgi:AraC-like DNA-binding protein